MKQIFLIFAVALITFSGCKKPTPEITGEWETVTPVGFKWLYKFYSDGSACRELNQYFDARFCYNYAITARTCVTVEFVVQKQEPETWTWSWVDEGGHIADVTVTATNGGQQRFILKRLS